MIKRITLLLILAGLSGGFASGQAFEKTSDLFRKPDGSQGSLNIVQDPSIDTLISRYIIGKQKLYEKNGYLGMDGYRIQIYSSANRNAREESGKARAEFMSRFPDIVSYPLFADPGYFKVRVGDFRTKAEATKPFLEISRYFPDAYIVPDFICFPDQNSK